METVIKNIELFDLLKTNFTLLDSELVGVKFGMVDYALTMEMDFIIKKRFGGSCLKLKFLDIKEYGFYYDHTRIFYNVEDFKLLRKDDLFYLSLDPYLEDRESISENDNDFVLAREIEGFKYEN